MKINWLIAVFMGLTPMVICLSDTFSEEDLFNYLRFLYFEISLETVRRNTNIAPAPATLETILTNRDVSWEE